MLGDKVLVRNYHNGERLLPGVVEKKTGPVSYDVRVADGRHRRCHQDQIRFRSVDIQERVTLELDVYLPPVVIANPTTTTTPNPMIVEDTPSPGLTTTTVDSTPIQYLHEPPIFQNNRMIVPRNCIQSVNEIQ